MYKDPKDPRNKASKLKHYYNNKEQYYERNRQRKQDIKDLLDKIKSAPCMDCKNSFPPICMDFDHRPGEEKLFELAKMQGKGWGKEKILSEVNKCDVICSNCHRIRTEKRRSSDK